MAYMNVQTGEVLDYDQLTDEQIVEHLADLEELATQAKAAVEGAKQTLMIRMEREGAKLRITPLGKVRLHKSSRAGDRRNIEKLYEECPEELKEACFKHDVRPIKSGLNELAKLGDDWKMKVDACYKESATIKVDWALPEQEPEPEPEQEPTKAELKDCPF